MMRETSVRAVIQSLQAAHAAIARHDLAILEAVRHRAAIVDRALRDVNASGHQHHRSSQDRESQVAPVCFRVLDHVPILEWIVCKSGLAKYVPFGGSVKLLVTTN